MDLIVNNKVDEDVLFFQRHPDRKARIRKPRLVQIRDKQRAIRYAPECEGEFWSLGEHDKERRWLLLTRVDFKNNPLPDHKIIKLPLLAFADETIEDTDEVLLPLIEQIMTDQLKRMQK